MDEKNVICYVGKRRKKKEGACGGSVWRKFKMKRAPNCGLVAGTNEC